MRVRRSERRWQAGLAAATVAVLALAGCGDDGDSGDDEPVATGDPALADLVPDSIKSDGTIAVGVDATYPPNESLDVDGETVVGWDVDLFDAVAGKLGLGTEWVPAPFGNIIPGIQSGQYEVGVSSFTINDERKAETNMVSYFNAGTQWAAPAGEPVDPDNACGLRVAVQRDTIQVDDLTARSDTCTDAGEDEITIEQFQSQEQATASVVSGQNDAMLADSPVCAYAVLQTDGELELAGDIYDAAPYGYVVNQAETQFAEALREAVAAVIADGSYTSILTEWGVEDGAITDPAVNP
ncbi:MAG: transporter substrate-binding domain-containing protein [Micromonosporaceae bacterium]|nr:transporter substrate-binding domain-containing protein [Micromonosporaceae bacterium]